MAAMVRVAVLGVGSLGRQHARIYGEMHRQGAVELVGVYDTASALAKSIAEKHGTAALGSVEATAAAADALRVVTPTITHHALATPVQAGRAQVEEWHVTVEQALVVSGKIP